MSLADAVKTLAGAAGGGLIAYTGFYAQRSSNKVQKESAQVTSYKEAREIDKGINDRLQDDVVRITNELREVRAENHQIREDHRLMQQEWERSRIELFNARMAMETMQRELSAYAAKLMEAGLPLPIVIHPPNQMMPPPPPGS
jgi:predicted RNase H-like nuclease (RuvC/YqgF family)